MLLLLLRPHNGTAGPTAVIRGRVVGELVDNAIVGELVDNAIIGTVD